MHLVRGRLAIATEGPAAALTECEQADAILAEQGSRYPARVLSLCLLGDIRLAQQDLPGALRSYEGALGLGPANGIADHPMLAAVHLGMAVAHERLGNVHEAETQSARAREILDTSLASRASNPIRILMRRRDALARM
jgi:tetratricopeptide (TPR) repeat protein